MEVLIKVPHPQFHSFSKYMFLLQVVEQVFRFLATLQHKKYLLSLTCIVFIPPCSIFFCIALCSFKRSAINASNLHLWVNALHLLWLWFKPPQLPFDLQDEADDSDAPHVRLQAHGLKADHLGGHELRCAVHHHQRRALLWERNGDECEKRTLKFKNCQPECFCLCLVYLQMARVISK